MKLLLLLLALTIDLNLVRNKTKTLFLKLYFQSIFKTAFNFQNTRIMTNLILVRVSIEHVPNTFFPEGFSQWNVTPNVPPCYKCSL